MIALLLGFFIFNLFSCHALPTDYDKILKDDTQFDSAAKVDTAGYDIGEASETSSYDSGKDVIESEVDYIPLVESANKNYEETNSYYDDELQEEQQEYNDAKELDYLEKEAVDNVNSEPTLEESKVYEKVPEYEYVVSSVDVSKDYKPQKETKPSKKDYDLKEEKSVSKTVPKYQNPSKKNAKQFLKSIFIFGPVTVNVGEIKLNPKQSYN